MDDLKIDLNCDMGEGYGNDAKLMRYISSANVACGYHAGDRQTMHRTIETAVKCGVAIGAHPGYPDRENFGRTNMQMSAPDVYKIVRDQIAALTDVAAGCGTNLRHVKPHGALYNQAARDPELASAIAEAVWDSDPSLVLFNLSGSPYIASAEDRGLRVASEVFADRTYQEDGSLTPRSRPDALISDIDTSAAQVMQMVTERSVTTVGGTTIPIRAETICIHGDGPHAIEFAKAINQVLRARGIEIGPV